MLQSAMQALIGDWCRPLFACTTSLTVWMGHLQSHVNNLISPSRSNNQGQIPLMGYVPQIKWWQYIQLSSAPIYTAFAYCEYDIFPCQNPTN